MIKLVSRLIDSKGLIVALAVLDVLVLVAAYWISHRPAPKYEGTLESPIASQSANPTSDGGGTSEITGPVILATSPAGAIFRATRGSCDARNASVAKVVAAVEPGSTPVALKIPDLQEVLGASRPTDNKILVVGASPDCEIRRFQSDDGGNTWKSGAKAKAIRDVWYLSLDTTATAVFDPEGAKLDAGCTPFGISPTGDNINAIVVCADKVVQLGANAGSGPVTVSGVGAAAKFNNNTVVLAPGTNCKATLSKIVSPDRVVATKACVGSGFPLGMVASKRLVFAQVGPDMFFSNDSGKSWKPLPIT